jgi:hypothetical protein
MTTKSPAEQTADVTVGVMGKALQGSLSKMTTEQALDLFFKLSGRECYGPYLRTDATSPYTDAGQFSTITTPILNAAGTPEILKNLVSRLANISENPAGRASAIEIFAPYVLAAHKPEDIARVLMQKPSNANAASFLELSNTPNTNKEELTAEQRQENRIAVVADIAIRHHQNAVLGALIDAGYKPDAIKISRFMARAMMVDNKDALKKLAGLGDDWMSCGGVYSVGRQYSAQELRKAIAEATGTSEEALLARFAGISNEFYYYEESDKDRKARITKGEERINTLQSSIKLTPDGVLEVSELEGLAKALGLKGDGVNIKDISLDAIITKLENINTARIKNAEETINRLSPSIELTPDGRLDNQELERLAGYLKLGDGVDIKDIPLEAITSGVERMNSSGLGLKNKAEGVVFPRNAR